MFDLKNMWRTRIISVLLAFMPGCGPETPTEGAGKTIELPSTHGTPKNGEIENDSFENHIGTPGLANPTTALCATSSFAPAVDYTLDGRYAVADINGDTYPDISFLIYDAKALAVAFNNGDGTFAVPIVTQLSAHGNSITAADMNQDTKIDLVVTLHGTQPDQVGILLNDGNGNFTTQEFSPGPVAGFGWDLALVQDFNADGTPDLVFSSQSDSILHVLLNLGGGTFGPVNSYFAGDVSSGGVSYLLSGIIPFDLDGNGAMDIATAGRVIYLGSPNSSIGYLIVMRNDGNGGFIREQPYSLSGWTNSNGRHGQVFSSDINGDGKADLIYAAPENPSINILTNNGNNTFTFTNYPKISSHGGAFVADVNGDGYPDMGTGSGSSHELSTWQGLGNGSFAPRVDLANLSSVPNRAVDLNGDGKLDLLGTNGLYQRVLSVYMNICQ